MDLLRIKWKGPTSGKRNQQDEKAGTSRGDPFAFRMLFRKERLPSAMETSRVRRNVST